MNTAALSAKANSPGWFGRLDPRAKLGWAAWVSTVSVLVDHWPALLVLALLAAVTASGVRAGRTALLAVAIALGLTVWGTVFSQALFYAATPRTVWLTICERHTWGPVQLPGLSIYREGAIYGATQSLRLVAVAWTGWAVALSTSPERLLVACTALRIPALVSLPATMALRFLPILAEQWQLARRASRLRAGVGKLGWTTRGRWQTEWAMLEPVLAVSLRRARVLASSITSRGFDPAATRTAYPPLQFSGGEQVCLVLLALSLVALVVVKLLVALYLAELYYQPGLRTLYGFARRYL